MREIITNFFKEETHPINLAVFRIALFATLIVLPFFYPPIWFSQLPEALKFPPYGLGFLAEYFPINEAWARAALSFYFFFCVLGLIGLLTRFSAWMALLLGLYLFAIPNWYGKITHYHHVFWFAALLAVSRAGDFFSCDGVLKAFRRADQGHIEPPGPSQAYSLPIRFAWFLIGILYFFPGMWKLKTEGHEWITSDNLKWQIYEKWLDWDGWMPVFRIDQYPLLYKFSALATVAFEVSFIVLIFIPFFRLVLFFGGLVFHNLTYVLIRISFWYLQTLYVILLDWNLIFEWLGRRLFRDPMHLVYDGNCKLCRRTIAAVRVFDIFHRVRYVNALDQAVLKKEGLAWLDLKALLYDMHAVVNKNVQKGFLAYRALAWRVPPLWLALPFLFLNPVVRFANQIYRHVADSRTCAVPAPALAARGPRLKQGVWPVIFMGVFLVGVNGYYGIANIHSWPFSIYPTFDAHPKPERVTIQIVPLNAAGEEIPLEDRELKRKLYHTRARLLFKRVLTEKDSPKFHDRLKALWQMCADFNPRLLREAVTVRFYKANYSLLPEQQAINPVSREFLFEFNP